MKRVNNEFESFGGVFSPKSRYSVFVMSMSVGAVDFVKNLDAASDTLKAAQWLMEPNLGCVAHWPCRQGTTSS